MKNRLARIATLAVAVLTLGGLGLTAAGAAGASTHPAKSNATLVCSFNCFNLSNLQLDATGVGSFIQNHNAKGQVFLRSAGIAKTNEDFQFGFNTTVAIGCAQGFLAPDSVFCLNPLIFAGDPVIEADVAPDGNQNGQCVGLPVANVAGRLDIQPCGVSPTTTWVIDTANFTVPSNGQTYAGVLNGADTSFSHPLALTVNPSSKSPKNVLRADEENLTASFLPDTQLFTFTIGHATA